MESSEESARQIIINPYYAITFSEHLFEDHDQNAAQEDWAVANVGLIKELGAQTWLTNLLATLKYEEGNRELAQAINPRQTVIISERLRGEHEPAIEPADWVAANVKLMNEIGSEKWLWSLLKVLEMGGPKVA